MSICTYFFEQFVVKKTTVKSNIFFFDKYKNLILNKPVNKLFLCHVYILWIELAIQIAIAIHPLVETSATTSL
jgi:hypothetical protein